MTKSFLAKADLKILSWEAIQENVYVRTLVNPFIPGEISNGAKPKYANAFHGNNLQFKMTYNDNIKVKYIKNLRYGGTKPRIDHDRPGMAQNGPKWPQLSLISWDWWLNWLDLKWHWLAKSGTYFVGLFCHNVPFLHKNANLINFLCGCQYHIHK